MGGFARRAMTWVQTRCSSSGAARRGSPSPPRTASRSRSTRTSTPSWSGEGRVYDLIHTVNTMRKEAGLELTDRIDLTVPEADADLLTFADWIARETLAVSVEAAGSELRIEKAE